MAAEIGRARVEHASLPAAVNAGDGLEYGNVYFTVTGTSAYTICAPGAA